MNKINIQKYLKAKHLNILLLLLCVVALSGSCDEKMQYSWTDLPRGELSEILYQYDSSLDAIQNNILQYHQISKMQWPTVYHRVEKLLEIADQAVVLSKKRGLSRYHKEVLIDLSSIARNKARYLEELKQLKTGKTIKILHRIQDVSIIPAQYHPLITNNAKKYNHKTEEIWGQYHLESLDPCHRRLLNDYYESWQLQCKDCKPADFFLWLETKPIPVLLPSIKLLGYDELQQAKVHIKEGILLNSKMSPITTIIYPKGTMPSKGPRFDQEHIFIIDAKQDMYLTYSGSEVGHPSLSHYKPLISSGKLIIKKGIIKTIAFDSGHYLPKVEHALQTLDFFENRGVQIIPNTRLEYFIGHEHVTTTVGIFKEIYAQS